MFEQIEAEELNCVDAGHLRSDDAFIGGHHAIAPEHVEAEMDKFFTFLRSGIRLVEAGQMHAVELAALAHYYFVKF